MNFITKKIQKCFFLCCFIATIGTINAQGTYTPSGGAGSNVMLTTQAEVMSLDTALGTNTIFDGNLSINETSASTDDPITDLSAFSNLTEIGGYLFLGRVKQLTALSHATSTSGVYAFNALETITGNLVVGDFGSTTSITNIGNFPNLRNIGGNFNIPNNPSLSTIDTENFPALATIGGNLDVTNNDMLSTIAGFSALTSIGGGLIIVDQDALTTIGDFSALTTIEGELRIGGTGTCPNDVLTTLGDFSALTSIGGTIQIANNPALADCGGLPVAAINSVRNASPRRSVIISDNAVGCFADATLTTQANVDALSLGDATVFIGNITISEASSSTPAIDDLSVFKNITEIRGNLTITATKSLTTLSHETSTSGEYAFNALDTITGNFNVGSLATTTSLTTLGTFPNLISIGGALVIRDNEELQSFGDLSALASIGAYLRISHNEKLTDLGGLSALTSIGEANGVLVPSKDANIDSVSIIVESNTTLAACCDLTNLFPGQANAVTGSVFINSNAEGCNIADTTGTDIEKVTAFVAACEAPMLTLSATGITAPTDTETNYTASAAAAGDTLTIDITLENATGWEVMITDAFVTSVPTMGDNDVDAVLTIAENTTTSERTDTITFTSTGGEGAVTQTLVITQLAAGETLPTLTIASTGITAPTGGATAYTADAVVAGEMLTIDITLENATGWEVMITGAFVTSAPTMGNNDVDAVLTITKNTTTDERMATITFTSTGGDATVSQTLIITQEAAEPTLEITGRNVRPITSEAGTEDIIIASNTDFRVSTSDDLVTSLTFTPESGSAGTPIVPSSGSITLEGMGNGTLQIAYSENTTTDARTGTLTLSALDASNVLTNPTPITITLTQEAPATSPRLRIAASGITAPVGSETNYTYNASVAGETLTIDVTLTGGATDWTVIADAFVTSAPTTGNDDVDAVLTITENTTTDERMATLIFTSSGGEGKIDTQTFVITQAAAAKIMLTSHAEGDSIAIAHDSTDPITIDFTLGGSATGWKDTIIYMPDTTNFVTMDTLKDDTISITITPSANTGAAARTATITLITTGHEGTPDSVSLTIRQGARADTTVTLPPKDTTTTLYSYTGVDFSLYPNPTKGNLTIEGITGYLQIYIHDLVGREVMTYSLTPSKKTIDVSNLPSGMYIVTLQGEEQTWTEVLVIDNG